MRKIVLSVFAALLLNAASVSAQKLVILHTNDTHSHLDASREGQGGVIERAAYIDGVRKEFGRKNVLLLHGGDFNQGTSYFTLLGGDLEVSLVNALKYDCITLGNHEFDNGIEDLARRADVIDCPIVCANYDFTPFPILRDKVKPYAILKKSGMKIGIIGVLCDLSSVVSRATSDRIPHLDDVKAVDLWADYLKNVKKCDLVIVLSHMGFEEDMDIASKTSNVDIFVGGHSHTDLNDLVYVTNAAGEQVPVTQDGQWGLAMGRVEIY